MNSTHGMLLFFRKDGKAGTSYQLYCGKTTIGSSTDADIRLKLNNTNLECIHCIIDVNENGIAALLNKSVTAPVKVNAISVRKIKVLKHGDKIELVGKQFQYLNEEISEEDVERHQKFLNQAIATPSKRRQSVAPLIKSSKKTPSVRTKPKSMRKSFAGSSMEFEVSDIKIRDGRSITAKSKTTSKVVVSKALGSPRTSKRRLSLGSNPKDSTKNPKVSTRNILLSEHVVSSTITEEDEIVPTKPSLSMKNVDMYVNEDVEFLDESNISLECQLEDSPSSRRINLKTPSKSSINITTPRTTTAVTKKSEALTTPVSSKKSSFSPIKKMSRNSPVIKDSGDISSPRRSVLRKSLRKSQMEIQTFNGKEEQTSSEESICLETESPKSKVNEGERKPSPKNSDARKSVRRSSVVVGEQSLRKNEEKQEKSDDEREEEVETQNEESVYRKEDFSVKLDRKSRRSSYFKENLVGHSPSEATTRKSSRRSSLRDMEYKQEKNENKGEHYNKLCVESRLLLRKSKIIEKEGQKLNLSNYFEENKEKPSARQSGETQDKDEHSLDKSATKLRQPLRITKDFLEEGPDNETQSSSDESTDFQRLDRSSGFEENDEVTSPEELGIKNPSRRNSIPEKSPMENPNISLDKSFTESRLSLRKNKINDEKKWSSSSEESLHLNLSNTESKRESIPKSKCSLNACCGGKENALESRCKDSVTKLRQSFTKTEMSLVKTPNRSITRLSRHEQSLQEESFVVTETNSPDRNGIKSRQSFRKSGVTKMEQVEMRDSSSEDSLHLELSGSSGNLNESLRKSDGSGVARRSSTRSTQSLRKSKDKDQDSLLEGNVDATVKLRNSKSLGDEDLDMSSSEDSWHLNLSETDSTKGSLNGDSPPTGALSNRRRSRRSIATCIEKKDDNSNPSDKSETVQLLQQSSKKKQSSMRRSHEPSSGLRRDSLAVKARSRANNTISEIPMEQQSSIRKSRESPAPNKLDTSFANRESRSRRLSSIRKSVTSNEDTSSSLVENLPTSPEQIENEVLRLSSEDETMHSPDDRRTPRLRRSSVKKSNLSTTSQSEDEESHISINKSSTSRSSRHKISLIGSTEDISVITVSDSVDCTPQNNTSIIILDTPLERTRKSTRKKLSKTLDSTIQDEMESATPKSAIRSRRSKSLPYKPITEDVTPASPLEKSKTDSGFKTPLNTPGLFENIRKSVLKSRSRTQRSSSCNLMEELSKVEPKTKAIKRARESGDLFAERSTKRRKVMEAQTDDSFVTDDQDLDSSFESFRTEDILPDISDQDISQTTPEHFSDLTDKPVINVPKTRSLTDPKKIKSAAPHRRSLHTMRLESHMTGTSRSSDVITATTFSSQGDDEVFEDSDASSRRSSLSAGSDEKGTSPEKIGMSPRNDLSDVAGLKKLLRTPKATKSPKNDLTNVPNLRRLMSPKLANSPKNDLENIVGFKKLFATPKQQKSPRNDLAEIPSLRKLMSPKTQKSPKNDLSDVAGLKKLLSTPKQAKSPANDLTNVPNLRRIMSPKQQNSPRNDLTQVRGLKRLMKTPAKQKSPVNDLSNVEGVASVFNVSGAHRLSNESDIENNEDLFDKLFAKRPLRTYRGRSLSPTTRKDMLYGKDRKTVGDAPITSPRVEKWVEEQAVIKMQSDENNDVDESVKETRAKAHRLEEESKDSSRRGKRKADQEIIAPKRTLKRQNKVLELVEDKTESPRRMPRARGKVAEIVEKKVDSSENGLATDIVLEVDMKSEETEVEGKMKPTTRSGRRKAVKKVEKPIVSVQEENSESGVEEEKVVKAKANSKRKPARGKRKAIEEVEEAVESSQVESSIATSAPKQPPAKPGRRKKTQTQDEQIAEVHSTTVTPEPSTERTRAGKLIERDVPSPRPKRGRRGIIDKSEEEVESPKPTRVKRKMPDSDDAQLKSKAVVVIEEMPMKGGRKRRNVKTIEDEKMSSESEAMPVRAKGTRNRRAEDAQKNKDSEEALKVEEIRKTKTRSRKAVPEAEQQEIQVSEDAKKEENKVKAPIRRGTRRGAKQVEEEIEEPPVRATRTRGKALVVEEALDIDSPRTARAKRGNYQKYGNDFVTESPISKSKSTRKVHFMETEISADEGGENNTHAAKNQTRRSRRTRK